MLVTDDNPAIHRDFVKILSPNRVSVDASLAELEADLLSVAPPSPEDVLSVALDSAYQGEQGVAMVAQALREGDPYAVAFVDVRMPPGMDGIGTVRRMWDVDPRLQVVICTAFSDHTWTDMIRALGSNDRFVILKKPFDGVEVLQLTQALGRKWHLALEAEKQFGQLELMVKERTKELEKTTLQLQKEVAARHQAALKLERLATHDSLTGLANRVLLNDQISSAISRAQRHGTKVGLFLLDLDGFKTVNDTHGHDAGDEILRITADRLRATLRESDTIARIGGDEFVVVAEEVNDAKALGVMAQRIVDECSQPVTIDGHELYGVPSIGIGVYPEDAAEPVALLKCADVAMYEAKRGTTQFHFFSQELASSALAKVRMRQELARGLEDGEFELFYQPLQRLNDGQLCGMEALVRWRHPKRGIVPPMSFIPEAEASGLIVPLGEWVLSEACAQLAAWQRDWGAELSVAVNISARQLSQPDFADTVNRIVTDAGIAPDSLELEITETTAFEDVSRAREVLASIADFGVRIFIDDFGSGYSSLNRLRALPVHGLKLDRFFVQDIANDPISAAIVMAVVTMAHSLGMDVVAEGVETLEQLDSLRHLKWPDAGVSTPMCSRVQGYYLGRPAPAEQITSSLQKSAAEVASPPGAAPASASPTASAAVRAWPGHLRDSA